MHTKIITGKLIEATKDAYHPKTGHTMFKDVKIKQEGGLIETIPFLFVESPLIANFIVGEDIKIGLVVRNRASLASAITKNDATSYIDRRPTVNRSLVLLTVLSFIAFVLGIIEQNPAVLISFVMLICSAFFLRYVFVEAKQIALVQDSMSQISSGT